MADRVKRLVEGGRGMAPSDILREIGEIEGERALKYRPDVDYTAKATFHEHFIPRLRRGAGGGLMLDSERTAGDLRGMWERARLMGVNSAAILSHSMVDKRAVHDMTGEEVRLTPETIHGMVSESMPQDLKSAGFQLLPAVEFRVKNVEVVVVGSDRGSVFGNQSLWEAKSAQELAKAASGDGRLLAFFPHPFLGNGGAANERNLGVGETARLMGEYGVGVELNGMNRELELACRRLEPLIRLGGRIPGVGSAGKRLRRSIADTERLPVLSAKAPFKVAGGDFHILDSHLGEAAMIVHVRRKPLHIPLEDAYTIEDGPAGLAVLKTSGKAKAQALLEAVRDPAEAKSFRLPPDGQSLTKTMTLLLAELLVGHTVREGRLLGG
jgi:hypothetical protein